MSSTRTTFPIAVAENLHLRFRAQLHPVLTWRDLFTRSHRTASSRNQLEVVVARGLNFEIHPGDRIGILGVNGAGKSSLCRCLAGIYQPTAGRLDVYGRVRAIFDTSLGILPDLTGRENAELLAELLYPEHPNREELVEDALKFSGLEQFLDVPFRNYSNGMQARLCLSVITCAPSDLLILDEVFDGADRFFREKAADRVLSMIARSGAVVFVSHSPEQIRRACNQVWILQNGQWLFQGDVETGLALYQGSAGDFSAMSSGVGPPESTIML
jgi:ABC-2 type transport system ATP-binding protein